MPYSLELEASELEEMKNYYDKNLRNSVSQLAFNLKSVLESTSMQVFYATLGYYCLQFTQLIDNEDAQHKNTIIRLNSLHALAPMVFINFMERHSILKSGEREFYDVTSDLASTTWQNLVLQQKLSLPCELHRIHTLFKATFCAITMLELMQEYGNKYAEKEYAQIWTLSIASVLLGAAIVEILDKALFERRTLFRDASALFTPMANAVFRQPTGNNRARAIYRNGI